jgi:spore coat polysaccharide biosynthesis predicted glycosyltransferase SpsG
MPALMKKADLAISSGGRTITELVSLGVPVLCLCQNEKELTHTHASARYGVVNLGLGELVGIDTLAAHIGRLGHSSDLRKVLHTRALHETAGRSNAAVIRRIMQRIGWDD